MDESKVFCWIGELSVPNGHDCLVWVLLRKSDGTFVSSRAPVLCRQKTAITVLEDYLYEEAARIIEGAERQMGLPGSIMGQTVPDNRGVHVRWLLGRREASRSSFAYRTLRWEWGDCESERSCDAEIILHYGRWGGSGPCTPGGSATEWAEYLEAVEGGKEITDPPLTR